MKKRSDELTVMCVAFTLATGEHDTARAESVAFMADATFNSLRHGSVTQGYATIKIKVVNRGIVGFTVQKRRFIPGNSPAQSNDDVVLLDGKLRTSWLV